MNNNQPPKSLIVTGMHRSGTSMATRLLNLCGLHLGDPERLISARPDNPAGFWENLDFVALDDRILASQGAGWDLPPTESMDENRLKEFKQRAQVCVENAAEGASDTWGWKDPRCSLLVPFWGSILDDLRVVVCLRDPMEVAASLSKRNGFSTQLGLHLWNEYNSRLEQDLASNPHIESIVTHYESLLVHPREELGRLTRWLGWTVTESALDEACATIKPELRHHHCGRIPAGSPDGLEELYERLCRQAGENFCTTRQMDPTQMNQLNAQGEARFTEGNYSAAAEIFRRVVTCDPTHLQARNNLACALWQVGRRDDAVFELVTALKTNPDDADATWNLGQFLLDTGRLDEARDLLQAYLKRHPHAVEIAGELEQMQEVEPNSVV